MRKEFLPFAKPMVSEEAIADVADSIRKGWLAMGPKTVDFEQKFAELCRLQIWYLRKLCYCWFTPRCNGTYRAW